MQCLPPEIWVKCFQDPVLCSHVCRKWRSIALTPTLWTTVSSWRHAEWTDILLSRSGQLPKHIIISGDPDLSVLNPYIHLVQSIECGNIRLLDVGDAPMLQRLVVNTINITTYAPPIPPTLLQNLTTLTCRMDQLVLGLPGATLTHLSIAGNPHSVHSVQLFHLLSRFPLLQDLKLHQLCVRDLGDPPATPLYFPHLVSIDMLTSIAGCTLLLSHMKFTASLMASICLIDPPAPTSALIAALETVKYAGTQSSIYVDINNEYFVYRTMESQLQFVIQKSSTFLDIEADEAALLSTLFGLCKPIRNMIVNGSPPPLSTQVIVKECKDIKRLALVDNKNILPLLVDAASLPEEIMLLGGATREEVAIFEEAVRDKGLAVPSIVVQADQLEPGAINPPNQ